MGNVLEFFYRYRYTILFVLLLSIALTTLFSQKEEKSEAPLLQKSQLEVVGPFQKGSVKSIHSSKGIWEKYLYLVNLKEENRLLREIIEELKQERLQLLEERAENYRLRPLLGFKKKIEKPLLPAEIIGKDLSGWFQTFVIDRGGRDGIEEGMAVLSIQGIVGQVMEVSKSFARVLLITDPNSAVATLTQTTRARGIVEGNGQDRCRLKYLHQSESIQQGELILSSGLDGVYPKGLAVGIVSWAEKKEAEIFQEVEIIPSVDFRKLEEVMVLCEKIGRMEIDDQ